MTLENTTPKYVDIVFENCEVCRVDIEDIGHLLIGGVTKELFLQFGEILEQNNCRQIALWVRDNITYIAPYDEKETVILKDRIKQNDITQIWLIHESGEQVGYYVPYENLIPDYCYCSNKYQHNWFEEGYIKIYIGGSKDYKHYKKKLASKFKQSIYRWWYYKVLRKPY